MPRLRVLAGPSVTELMPIVANSGIPAKINSDAFEGLVAVYIKGIEGTQGKVGENEYFDQEERRGVTWSIQVQGRFLRPRSADDILFGNTFERPLTLPWGSSAALRFMSFIDPTLEHDLASSSKPWALSPLIATMPYFEHKRVKYGSPTPPFPPQRPVGDDTTQLRSLNGNGKGALVKEGSSKRRSYFQNALRRQEVVFGPDDLITADFCYDFLRFSPNGVILRLPGGITIDVMKYWDGQPVRFVCCERVRKGERVGDEPWGRVFWCVVIELAEDDVDVNEDEKERSDVD